MAKRQMNDLSYEEYIRMQESLKYGEEVMESDHYDKEIEQLMRQLETYQKQ